MPADEYDSDDAATDDRSDANSGDETGEYDDETGEYDDETGEYDDETGEYVGAYDKLVRDDIPSVVRADGNRPVTRRVDGTEYDRYLTAKLREEAHEVVDAIASQDATNPERDDELLSELADAYAVLDAIAAAREHSMAAVRERAREKADARGGFEDGVVLERIDLPASGDDDADDEA